MCVFSLCIQSWACFYPLQESHHKFLKKYKAMMHYALLVFGITHCVSGEELFMFGRRNIAFSYGYHPTLPPIITKSMTPTKSSFPISAPSASPKKTPPPSRRIKTTFPPAHSFPPFFASTIPTDSPVVVVVDECVLDNERKSAFTDVELLVEVETITRSLEFLDRFSQGLILAALEESNSFSPSTSFCLLDSVSTTGRKLLPNNQNGTTIVEVSVASIAEGKECVAETDGAACQVVLVSLRVYGKTLEDSQQGSIALIALLRSHFANQYGYFGDLSSDIIVLREHQESPMNDGSINDRPGSSSGRISKGATATIAVVSVLVASIVAAVFRFGRFRQQRQGNNDKNSHDAGGASSTGCDESIFTGLHTADPTLASENECHEDISKLSSSIPVVRVSN